MAGRDIERDRLVKKIAEKRAKLEARGDLKIKIPRLSLPSDFNINDRSVFSLPPELLKPILASHHPKYKKKLAEEKKKDVEHKAMLKSYTALKKQREEFRNRLVNLIVSRDDDYQCGPDEIPSAEEREMLRYYYYVKHGVDTVHVAPLDEKVLSRVLALVPRKLMLWEETLAKSIEDVKQDFIMAVKKQIIDFVLQDHCFVRSSTEGQSQFKKELKEIGNSFRPVFDSSKLKLERHLHVVNPCLAALLDVWYSKYRKLRLIDIGELMEYEGTFDLQEFKYVTSKHIERCKNVLMDKYYAEVVDIFLQGSKKNKLPDPGKPKKMTSFYNSVATIMTYHLQTLCLKSLYDYVTYITDVKYKNKGFQVKLLQRGDMLAFEPPFKNFRDALMKLIDTIIEAVGDIPRLETKLYLDWMGPEAFLKVGHSEGAIKDLQWLLSS